MKYALFYSCLGLLTLGGAAGAAPVYLNVDNISVSVGAGTGAGSSNNTFTRGFGIEKVIDAPSAVATEVHSQDTHIWYSFADPTDGLELIFDFGVSYDITTLHFWNYDGESFDVDNVDFSFYDSVGSLIGTQSLSPALGAPGSIAAEDINLVSPLNTRSVTAFLTGTNGEVDFQNIGFTANVSDPTLDPSVSPIPLPASGLMLLGGLAGFGALRKKRS